MDGSTFDSSNASTVTATRMKRCEVEDLATKVTSHEFTDCNLHMHQMELD
jgi:hypothetical protein